MKKKGEVSFFLFYSLMIIFVNSGYLYVFRLLYFWLKFKRGNIFFFICNLRFLFYDIFINIFLC